MTCAGDRAWRWASVAAAVAACVGCGRVGFDSVGDGGNLGSGRGDGSAGIGDGATGSGTMNLESTIEMLGGASLASDGVGAIDFDRTQTALDTLAYDGAVTYAFEVIATNIDATTQPVELVDVATGFVIATVTVGAAAGSPTRYRVAFAPIPGGALYKIRMPAADGAFDVTVLDARIIVDQVGASQTRLYFPLTSFEQAVTGDTNGDNNGSTDATSAATYGQTGPGRYSIWRKSSASYATLAAGTPWSFEAVLAANDPGHTAYASLFDRTTGTQVAASEVHTATATVIERDEADFADTAAAFTDGDDFEVQIRSDAAGSVIYLFKAGVWITLDNLTKAEIFLHLGGEIPVGDLMEDTPSARTLYNASAYSNPIVSFEAVAASGDATPIQVALVQDGMRDTDDDAQGVPGTTLEFTGKSRQRVGPLALVANDRFFVDVPQNGTPTMSSAVLAVDIRSP